MPFHLPSWSTESVFLPSSNPATWNPSTLAVLRPMSFRHLHTPALDLAKAGMEAVGRPERRIEAIQPMG